MNKTNNKSVIQLEFNVVDIQYKWVLKKSVLDSYIDLLKKYNNETRDCWELNGKLLQQLDELEVQLNIKTGYHIALQDIIDSMCCNYDGRNFTNQDIYNVLKILGYKII